MVGPMMEIQFMIGMSEKALADPKTEEGSVLWEEVMNWVFLIAPDAGVSSRAGMLFVNIPVENGAELHAYASDLNGFKVFHPTEYTKASRFRFLVETEWYGPDGTLGSMKKALKDYPE
jgi:hypothetical protein